MKKFLLLLFVMLIPMTVQSEWVKPSGEPIAETESMRTSGNFAVNLVLTPDEKQFRQSWNSTKGTPNLRSTNTVHQGSSIAAMLIFHGCAPNADGVCDVVAEFVLESPDGKKSPAGNGPVWSSAPLERSLLQLGLSSITVGFDRTDPVGSYKIIANVKDKNSGRSLSLNSKFTVTK